MLAQDCNYKASPAFWFFHHLKAIKPTIENGASIKYKIPAFKPCAGFSPSCWAVFVHMEHCACTVVFKHKITKIISNMKIIFFMLQR